MHPIVRFIFSLVKAFKRLPVLQPAEKNPQAQDLEIPLDITWDPSPNFSHRRQGKIISAIILHHTGDLSLNSTLSWFRNTNSGVSSHYVLGRGGELYQMVDDQYRAWHAGESNLHGETDVNSISIGIEMVGDGKTEFTEKQYQVVAHLCRDLKEKYNIQDSSIVGHKDIAPGRKIDPRPWDWDKFFSLLNR